MTNWLNKLDVSDLWKLYDDDEITMQECAKRLAIRVEALYNTCVSLTTDLDNLEEIKERFEEISQDETATLEEFNYIMADLYDWGDLRHNCWINTFRSLISN